MVQQNKSNGLRNGLGTIFSDTTQHIAISNMILEHIVPPKDIRKTALIKPDVSKSKNIIDIGCGFGFFTQALKGNVHPKATITGIDRHSQYKNLFLDSCISAGLKGQFFGNGISVLKEFESDSFDLAICSYALYFFPEYIYDISRILKKDGIFIIITHTLPHMQELSAFVKKILKNEGLRFNDKLPYELLIKNFSNLNGLEMLTPYFTNIKSYKCNSTLVFGNGDFENLEKYFRWKQSFFLPEIDNDKDKWMEVILAHVKVELKKAREFLITKDDVIFICSGTR